MLADGRLEVGDGGGGGEIEGEMLALEGFESELHRGRRGRGDRPVGQRRA